MAQSQFHSQKYVLEKCLFHMTPNVPTGKILGGWLLQYTINCVSTYYTATKPDHNWQYIFVSTPCHTYTAPLMRLIHCTDIIMSMMASQITSLMVVYSIVYWGADQRKHQSSTSLAFVRGIHRDW